jgi:two-component system phosphate regulon response regulator PhoB
VRRAKVLIINDYTVDGGLAKESLTEAGYDVSLAPNGESAKRSIEEGAPHLVIIDLVWPESSYQQLIHLIRQDLGLAKMPIILFCGATAGHLVVEALENGVDDVIKRPAGPREIIARVRAILRRAQTDGLADSGRFTPPYRALHEGAFPLNLNNCLG